MRQKIKLILLSLMAVVLLFTLTSCEDDILTKIYTGYLPEGEKTLNAGGQVELDEFKSFKFVSNEEKEIQSETITIIEFYFYSEDAQTVTLTFKWQYYTSIFNVEHTTELGNVTFTSSDKINEPILVSFELEEDNYFVIKNNKTQYLIIDVSAPEGFKCFMKVPDIFLLTEDDESKLEDEFDEEIEEGDE